MIVIVSRYLNDRHWWLDDAIEVKKPDDFFATAGRLIVERSEKAEREVVRENS